MILGIVVLLAMIAVGAWICGQLDGMIERDRYLIIRDGAGNVIGAVEPGDRDAKVHP